MSADAQAEVYDFRATSRSKGSKLMQGLKIPLAKIVLARTKHNIIGEFGPDTDFDAY